jgi:hypothetical protein
MREPRDHVTYLEEGGAAMAAGSEERFAGYSVIGLPFASGHILALRRFPASSIGPAYTSIWHREPDGRWIFYQDVVPGLSCSRYFGRAISENVVEPIQIEWTGPRSFTATVAGDDGLRWDVQLASAAGTRLLNAMGRCVPESWWRKEMALSAMGAMVRVLLHTGKLRFTGQAPNGQRFVANPQLIWLIAKSHAVVRGQDLGPLGPTPEQGKLGDFLIPQRGLFAVARAFMESFDEHRHAAATSKQEGASQQVSEEHLKERQK